MQRSFYAAASAMAQGAEAAIVQAYAGIIPLMPAGSLAAGSSNTV